MLARLLRPLLGAVVVAGIAACAVRTSPTSSTTPASPNSPNSSATPATRAATRAAILAVLDSQRLAWNRGDLDGYLSGYAATPDLVFTSGGGIRRGFAETASRYRARYGGDRAAMGHLDFEILSVQMLGTDGAVVLGRWRLSATPNAGGGVFSVALERGASDGVWRIVHDHTSSDPPG